MPVVPQVSCPPCNPVLASELLGSHIQIHSTGLCLLLECVILLSAEKLEICDWTADLKVAVQLSSSVCGDVKIISNFLVMACGYSHGSDSTDLINISITLLGARKLRAKGAHRPEAYESLTVIRFFSLHEHCTKMQMYCSCIFQKSV